MFHHQSTALSLCTLLLFLLAASFLAAETAETPQASSVTLLYSTNVLGEIEPCG
ncbi:MAG: hypothetical protein ACWGOX_10335 [Desulforhopalus sp.]